MKANRRKKRVSGGGTDTVSKALVAKTPAKRIHTNGRAATGAQLARMGAGEIPAYVTLAEIKAAREHATAQGRILIGLLWGTGCRISEALDLRVANLDANYRTVQLVTLKRKKPMSRIVPVLGDEYFPQLLGWCHTNQRYGADRVFTWRRAYASRMITAALVAAGVERGRARPHAIRHGHAVHAIKNRTPLNHIQRMLGHASLMTTGIYLQVTAVDIRDAQKGVEW